MAFDPKYIAAFNIEDVLLDKDTGQPLTGGKVYFEVFNQPGVLKPVWQVTYSSGIYTYVQLPNPMILSSIGTFVDSLDNPVIPYFYPYDANGAIQYYRVKVLSSGDVEQFVRDPVPSVPDSGSSAAASAYENELSNPQFAEVLFDTSTSTYVYNFNTVVSEVVTIAPDWDIVVTSPAAGTVTVSQVKPAGSLNIITNPGTLLTISSSGLTSLILRQRLYGSPNLWGNGNIAATFVAKVSGGTSAILPLKYSQSNGAISNITIVSANLPGSGEYAAYPDTVSISTSTSTETFPDAYIDIYFEIPLSREVTITSVMVTATGSASVPALVYDQISQDRQIDYLFHYYKPQLEFKPIPSMLIGWDFPLNPAQARGTTVTMPTSASIPTAANCYIWDQTISNSLVASVAVIRNTVTGGFQATTASADEAFYMIQYLSGSQAKKILGTPLSVNVNAFRTQAGGAVTCKVYLYSARTAATFPSLPTMIGTVAANGVFTLTAANWSLIPRGNLGTASGVLSTVSTLDYSTLNDVEDLSFFGWQITDATQLSDTDKFAIVVTFSCPTNATVITVNSISVVPGEIPTRPAPQDLGEVLRECQYYYEKSYQVGTAVGAATFTNSLTFPLPIFPAVGDTTMAVHDIYAQTFGFKFNAVKRTSSGIITYYNPNVLNSPDFVHVTAYNGGVGVSGANVAATSWTSTREGDMQVQMIPNTGAALFSTGSFAGAGQSGSVELHYTVEERLGIV